MTPRTGATASALVAFSAAAGIVGPVPSPPASAQTAERPNVLIFVTDDQRNRDTMGVMPRTRDWFGEGGTQYTKAVATTPLCCPSRASIFTGRYAHNHGVLTNHDPEHLDHASTVQRYLDQAGYRTAIAGKFLNKYPLASDPPHFDRWAVGAGTYNDSSFNIDGDVRTVPGYSTDFLASWATSTLHDFEAADADPWLLFVAPKAPHDPFTPEPGYEEAPVGTWAGNPAVFEQDRSDKPPYVRTAGAALDDALAIREVQLRTLMSVDDLVARLAETLAVLGEGNTLAFFLSDNGYLWAEHGLLEKSKPYLQSLEIPLYMRWAGRVPAGDVNARLVGTIDILPTILDAAGLSPDPRFPPDSQSLLSDPPRRRILTEHWEDKRWASLRGPGYQYIEHYNLAGEVSFREYYDLRSDYWQLDNLLTDGDPTNDPDVATLSAQLDADRTCHGTSGQDACPSGRSIAQPSVAAGDAWTLEGDSGDTAASFPISLSHSASSAVTVTYATQDETATAGSDYRPTTGEAVIPAGSTSATITVPVAGDTLDEPDETFSVRLITASGATIDDWRDGHGIGTILDDDPTLPASISIDDVTVVEGNAGSVDAVFGVSLSNPSPREVTVEYATADGTASAGSDYRRTVGNLTVPAWDTTAQVQVPVLGDTVDEPDETFFVDLSNPSGAVITDGRGVGTIVDDDEPLPPPELSIDDVVVVEGNGRASDAWFTASLDRPATSTVTAAFATRAGTAEEGLDYSATAGSITIPAGQGDAAAQGRGPRGHAGRAGRDLLRRSLEPLRCGDRRRVRGGDDRGRRRGAQVRGVRGDRG